jgi:hypothetical protein
MRYLKKTLPYLLATLIGVIMLGTGDVLWTSANAIGGMLLLTAFFALFALLAGGIVLMEEDTDSTTNKKDDH